MASCRKKNLEKWRGVGQTGIGQQVVSDCLHINWFANTHMYKLSIYLCLWLPLFLFSIFVNSSYLNLWVVTFFSDSPPYHWERGYWYPRVRVLGESCEQKAAWCLAACRVKPQGEGFAKKTHLHSHRKDGLGLWKSSGPTCDLEQGKVTWDDADGVLSRMLLHSCIGCKTNLSCLSRAQLGMWQNLDSEVNNSKLPCVPASIIVRKMSC